MRVPDTRLAEEWSSRSILHTIPYIGVRQGGPVESLRLLTEAQAALAGRVRVVHTGRRADGPPAAFHPLVEVVRVPSLGPARYCPAWGRAASGAGFFADVVHVHGLWCDTGRQAHAFSTRRDIPTVLSPCGMLQAGALGRKEWKKRFTMRLWQRRALREAAVLHAKSEAERRGIWGLFPTSRIELVPNPVPPPPRLPSRAEARQTLGELTGAQGNAGREHGRLLLYFGRISPEKGVDRLVAAWPLIAEQFPDWRLAIVGPARPDYRAQVAARLSRAAGGERVDFGDLVTGEAKWVVYRAADLVVVPSDFENFGMGVAEALSCGCPVVTTDGTPWRELATTGSGWWVERTAEALAGALADAMRRSPAELAAMGRKGMRLVRSMSPASVARAMLELYESSRSVREEQAGDTAAARIALSR